MIFVLKSFSLALFSYFIYKLFKEMIIEYQYLKQVKVRNYVEQTFLADFRTKNAYITQKIMPMAKKSTIFLFRHSRKLLSLIITKIRKV